MREACSMHGKDRKCIQHVGRKSEGKRPLGRPRSRWEGIRMDVGNRVESCGLDLSGSG